MILFDGKYTLNIIHVDDQDNIAEEMLNFQFPYFHVPNTETLR